MNRWRSYLGWTTLVMATGVATWHFSGAGRLSQAPAASLPPPPNNLSELPGPPLSASPVAATPLSRIVTKGGKAFSLETSIPEYDGPAKSYVEARLVASMQGDAVASYEIYLRTRACRLALESIDGAELQSYRQMGMKQQVLQRHERALEQCATLIASPGLVEGRWLVLAAQQGALEARLIYATDPAEVLGNTSQMLAAPEKVVAYRAQAVRYLQDAAGRGNLDSLLALSRAYENGILIERDPVMAYAYAAAVVRADPNPALADLESIPRQALSAAQLRRGQGLADQIYRSCCGSSERNLK